MRRRWRRAKRSPGQTRQQQRRRRKRERIRHVTTQSTSKTSRATFHLPSFGNPTTSSTIGTVQWQGCSRPNLKNKSAQFSRRPLRIEMSRAASSRKHWWRLTIGSVTTILRINKTFHKWWMQTLVRGQGQTSCPPITNDCRQRGSQLWPLWTHSWWASLRRPSPWRALSLRTSSIRSERGRTQGSSKNKTSTV